MMERRYAKMAKEMLAEVKRAREEKQ